MKCVWNNTERLESLYICYWNAHGYVSLVICVFGSITNIINILILTKKSMRNSINSILTGVATADLLTMTTYIPMAIHFYLMNDITQSAQKNSYNWMKFLMFHASFSIATHTVSIWLAVIMAVMRYIFVRPTARGSKTVTIRSSVYIIIVTYIAAVILTIPNALSTDMHKVEDLNETLWRFYAPAIGTNQTDTMALLNFWIYPVFGKIVPVVLISIFGGLLLQTLRETDKRGQRLKGDNTAAHRHNRRTTIMLLSIICMYIVSEVPQSILIILCACVDGFWGVYIAMGDIIDTVSLINSAINFIMYCTMSTQFRNELMDSTRHLCQTITGRCRKQGSGKNLPVTRV
ncbi:G-protein coupled receptor dmsr-1-like [Gigantopelta aegis]|uniref:G-protein coupled receptor dmsr-1-like n=1 Tax=Gigantopelta aegis TaxID=1735272 RepID=UPI001B889B9C|nr:G-protein coupled receptor dmsr-1-like [Gigantopelta aegis]